MMKIAERVWKHITCVNPDCKNPVENRATGECASCGACRRKAERMNAPKDKEAIEKVSVRMGKQLNQYATLKKNFMLKKWCQYHGKPCLPSDIHHQMGRIGFADDKEIPLLLDVRYWMPVCREAHKIIEENPAWSKDNGYSYSRLGNHSK